MEDKIQIEFGQLEKAIENASVQESTLWNQTLIGIKGRNNQHYLLFRLYPSNLTEGDKFILLKIPKEGIQVNGVPLEQCAVNLGEIMEDYFNKESQK